MGHSIKCQDLETSWDPISSQCKRCSTRKPGIEITPNCGFDDVGGQHEPSTKECKNGTFNDGSSARCRDCSQCPAGFIPARPCNMTSDTECKGSGRGTTGHPVTIQKTTNPAITATPIHPEPASPSAQWLLGAFAITITIICLMCACLIWRRRKRGYHRRSSYINSGFSPLSAPPLNKDSGHILSADVLSAPLQTVLDNLDVLEELVILLDPENQGVKNTKHLASHCFFPATWITYVYSMKDSKSPLKAVLEGVCSKHPDWTVGHLAERLTLMERNDAIAVLGKLGASVTEV